MKKEYKKPIIQSSEKSKEWIPVVAWLAGFAAGRAVMQAININRLQKISSLLPILTEVK